MASTAVQFSGDPRDVPEFRFRRMRHVRLEGEVSSASSSSTGPLQRLAVTKKYGQVFAGVTNGFVCLDLAQLESLDDVDKATAATAANAADAVKVKVELPATPTHLSVNADDHVLGVTVILKGVPHHYWYDTRAFVAQGQEVKPFAECSANTPANSSVLDFCWNPVLPSMLAVVYSNGSLALYMTPAVEDGPGKAPDCCTLPPAEGILCVSWSPKGKQLVAGKRNGTLTQYKPDLKEAKTIPAPPANQENPASTLSAISILWISTYQFLVAFKDNADQDARPGLYLVQSSKAGPTSYTNYDDICYSTGRDNVPFFHFDHLTDWGAILCASANAMEVAALGTTAGTDSWLQWLQPDEGRAEMPLSAKKEEVFPVGVAVGVTSHRKLPKDETNTYPSSFPVLLLLSPNGLLCPFYIMNTLPNAVQLTKPLESLNPAGQRPGTVTVPKAASATAAAPPSQVAAPPTSSASAPRVNLSSQFEGLSAPTPIPNKGLFGAGTAGASASGGLTITPLAPKSDSATSSSFLSSTPLKPPPTQQSQPTGTAGGFLGGTGTASAFGAGTGAFAQAGKGTAAAAPAFGSPAASTPAATAPAVSKTTPAPASQPGMFGGVGGGMTGLKPAATTTKEPPKSSTVAAAKPASSLATPASKSGPSDAEVDKGYQNAIHLEMQSFEREMATVKASLNGMDINIGTTENKHSLRQSVDELSHFCHDLKEITISQNREIRQLQSTVLESREWTEEAKSREVRNKDPRYQRLLKIRSLDPMSKKKLNGVESRFFYLENQLDEVNRALDIEWAEHIKRTKGIGLGRRVEQPGTEHVYHALVNQRKILDQQRTSVQKLADQIKACKITMRSPWTTSSQGGRHSSAKAAETAETMKKLTETFFEKSALNESLNGGDKSHPPPQPELAASPVKNYLSPEKESVLKEYLKARGTIKLRTVKPQSPNESRFLKINSVTSPQKVREVLGSGTTTPAEQAAAAAAAPSKSLGGSFLSGSPLGAKATPTPPVGAGLQFGLAAAKPAVPASIPVPALGLGAANSFNVAGTGFAASPASATTTSSTSFLSTILSKPVAKPATTASATTASAPAAASPKTAAGFSAPPSSSMAGGMSSAFSKTPAFSPSKSTTASASSVFGTSGTVGSVFGTGLPAFGSTAATISTTTTTTTSSVKSGGEFASSAPKPAGTTSTTTATTTTTSLTSTAFSFGDAPKAKPGASSVFGLGTSTLPKPELTSGKPAAAAPTTTNTMFGGITSSTAPKSQVAPESSKTTAGAADASSTKDSTPLNLSSSSSARAGSSGSDSGTSSIPGITPLKPDALPAPSSVFGGLPKTTISSFGGSMTTTSAFGAASNTTTTTTSATPSSSVFGTSATSSTAAIPAAATSSGSVFGGATKATATTTAGSVFGNAGSTASVFGSGSLSVFSSTPATTSAPATTTTAAGSVFGTTTTVSSATVFGGATPTTSSSSSSSSGSLFGGATTTSGTVFGGATGSASVFGGAAKTTTPATTAVAASTTASTSSPFATSAAASTTTSTSSPFVTSAAPTTASSVFGTAAAKPAGGSVFGNSGATTSAGSVFGAQTTGSGSVFGTPSSSTTTTAFGGATSATPSAFGGAASPAVSGSVFGAAAATPSSGSVFGAAATSTTAAASTSAPAASTTSSAFGSTPAFGAPASTGSIAPTFGTALSFGGTPSASATTASSSSPFGAKPTGSVFGGAAATTAASSTSVFGGGSTPSTSLFGSSSSTPFGAATPTSSAVTSAPSAFGGGATTQTSAFGSPAQSKPGGFGAPPAFGSPPAFGGSPAFGGAPAFGAAPAFGGAPAFGSAAASGGTFGGAAAAAAPTFGTAAASTGSTFGSSAQQAGATSFGGIAQQSGGATFGALAQSPAAPTFGAVAQQGGAFGQTAASPSGSVFGGAAASSTGFGAAAVQSPATGSTGFGGAAASPTSPSSPSFSSWR